MTWTKEKCPYCGKEGKAWQWNQRGGQSYSPCDHEIPDANIFQEESELRKKIGRLQSELTKVQNNIKNSNEFKGDMR